MSTVYANTISLDGGTTYLPIYADRAEKDQNGDNIEQTYAKKSGLATVATSGDYDDLTNKPSIPAAQVNADWNASSGVAEILNKPANLVQDASYVHTDNNFTTSLKDKLDGIASGAEVNVQANWNESDSSSDAYIQNKPQNLVQDASYVHTDNNFTTTLKDKLDGIASGAEVNVQSDWSQSDSSADDFIKNKPQNLVQDAAYVHTDNNFTTSLKDKLDGIASGAEVNVQADWSQSDSAADDFIKNKPTISNVPAVTSADDNKVLKASYSGGVGSYSWEQETAQVQSDWTESDTTDPAYIQNKPTEKNLVAGTNITITESGNNVTVATTVNGVPGVTSTDTGKYLKADYNGGSPTVSWDIVPMNTYTGGNMISISSNVVAVSTTAGITDIQVVSALPASPVSTVLYLIQET